MDGDDLYLSTKAVQISYNPCLLLMHGEKLMALIIGMFLCHK